MGQSVLHQLSACTVSLCVQKLVSPGVFAVQIYLHTSEDTAMCSTGNFHKEHTWDNSDNTAILSLSAPTSILQTEKEEYENVAAKCAPHRKINLGFTWGCCPE